MTQITNHKKCTWVGISILIVIEVNFLHYQQDGKFKKCVFLSNFIFLNIVLFSLHLFHQKRTICSSHQNKFHPYLQTVQKHVKILIKKSIPPIDTYWKSAEITPSFDSLYYTNFFYYIRWICGRHCFCMNFIPHLWGWSYHKSAKNSRNMVEKVGIDQNWA